LLSRSASYTISSLLTLSSAFTPPAITANGRPLASDALAAHIDFRPCESTNAVDTVSALSLGVVHASSSSASQLIFFPISFQHRRGGGSAKRSSIRFSLFSFCYLFSFFSFFF
jgi:hypothetical protein